MDLRLATILIFCFAPALFAQTGVWKADAATAFKRTGHATVEFNGRMWIMGGASDCNYDMGYYTATVHTDYNDVWSSADGTQWRRELAAAPWAARFGHALVVCNNRIWLLGGKSGEYVLRNDVWSSPDGVNWSQHTSAAPWVKRCRHTAVALNNRLFLLGGLAGNNTAKNDIWSSADGATWNLEASAAAWDARSGHASAVFNGRAWVIGGLDAADNFRRDVWSSSDGVNWSLATSSPLWIRRSGHQACVFDNKLWIAGGINGNIQWCSEVWCSSDGITWTQKPLAPWPGRANHVFGTAGNRLVVAGGFDGISCEHRADIWYSTDGSAWTQTCTRWPGRAELCSTVFNNRLWVIGGGYYDDVWSSADGETWQMESLITVGAGMAGHAVAAFNNKLWIFGGDRLGHGPCGDIWSSSDGKIWTKAKSQAWPVGFGGPHDGGLAYARCAVFNNRIWLVGGMDSTWWYTNRVWSSADGINWTIEGYPPCLDGRADFGFCAHNNRLWVIGGLNGVSNDVWSSQDGVNWTQATAQAAFAPRANVEATACNGRIWICGGLMPTGGHSEVWSSADGVNWALQTTNAPWDGRFQHTVASFDSRVFVMGGWTNESISSSLNGVRTNDVWSMEQGTAPQITSTAPATAVAGSQFSYTVTASGSPAPHFLAAGMPGWMSFDSQTGSFSGTPAISDIGVSGDITVSAVNAFGIAKQTFSITVMGPAPVFVSTPVTAATAGVAYAYTASATGGPPAPTLSASGVPAWLTFDPVTGILSGTPGVNDIGQTGDITITAANGTPPDAVQTFRIDVVGVSPVFTSSPVLLVYLNAPYLYTVTASGTPAPSFSLSGLPSWLSFDAASGRISGTPSVNDLGQSGDITITAANGTQPDAQQVFRVTVAGHAPAFTSTPIKVAYLHTDYLYKVTTTGLPTPTLSAANLPSWLSFNPATGELFGRPDIGAVGTWQIEIVASSATGLAQQQFIIEVPDPMNGGSDGAGGGGCTSGGGASFAALLTLLGALLLARRARSKRA